MLLKLGIDCLILLKFYLFIKNLNFIKVFIYSSKNLKNKIYENEELLGIISIIILKKKINIEIKKGKALKKAIDQKLVKREELFITTKIW